MADIVPGNAVKTGSDGRIGIVTRSGGRYVNVRFFDKQFSRPEDIIFHTEDVKQITLHKVKATDIKAMIRCEKDLSEVTDGCCILGDAAKRPKYSLTCEDLLEGISLILNDFELNAVIKWCYVLAHMRNDIGIYSSDPRADFDEQDMLEFICGNILSEYQSTESYEPSDLLELGSSLEICETLLDDFLSHDSFPLGIFRDFVSKHDPAEVSSEDPLTIQKYRRALEVLCASKVPEAIETRGYCYYYGRASYPNDWQKASKDLLEFYNLTGDPSAANSLGKICFYGKDNDGIPKFDQAFRYFSIGHAGGINESSILMGDMFATGDGVTQNGAIANKLYWDVYKENFNKIRRGDTRCDFADAAYRMGDCYRIGIGCPIDIETSYSYYLQAEHALRLREKYDVFGDEGFRTRVKSRIANMRRTYHDKNERVIFNYPGWIRWGQMGERRGEIRVISWVNGSLVLEYSPLKSIKEQEAPRMMVVVPSADYCAFKKTLVIRTAEDSSCNIYGGTDSFIFDEFDYDEEEHETRFFLDGIPAAVIKTSMYCLDVKKHDN